MGVNLHMNSLAISSSDCERNSYIDEGNCFSEDVSCLNNYGVFDNFRTNLNLELIDVNAIFMRDG
jgi:hypothetical protein